MSSKGKLAWGWIVLLVLLHHDYWAWGEPRIVLGFLPLELLWQMGISLGAGLGWFLVVRHAWPRNVEEWAAERDPGGSGPS